MKAAISIEDISFSYEEKRVLSEVSMNLRSGAIHGIVGPNGAGKSTLFKSVLGLLEPHTGSIAIHGNPIQSMRKQMAYVPQKDGVNWRFPATVEDVVMMGRHPHKRLFQQIDKHDHELVTKALADVGMEDFRQRQIGELSGGQQQRMFIARMLCQQADVLFLDEPFVGVDIKTEDSIVQILKRLAKEGKTILIIHHDLSKVDEYFDYVGLLNCELIAYGKVEDVFNKENISKAYGGQLGFLVN